jgi:UDP-glucose 4-epimerase
MVVPNFIKAALNGQPIPIHGDGDQSRCFGHVLDVIEGLAKAIETPECFGQVINLGNNEEVSIKELAEKIIAHTGSNSQLQFIPYEEAYGEGFEDMRRRVPNLEKAKRLVGYQPTRTLNDIISDVTGEFRDDIQSEKANG